MGRNVSFCVVICAVLLVAVTTRSDVGTTETGTTPVTPELITGTPVQPAPGSESPPRDPFEPYDTGGDPGWPYESLTAEEKAAVDRNADATAWKPVHDGFSIAVRELSARARAEVAQRQLGIDALTGVGVVQ